MHVLWLLCCTPCTTYHRRLLSAGLGGSPFRFLRASLSAGKLGRGQSVGSAAAPGPASVFVSTLVRSHPLPKPLIFLNSPRPQPFSWQDLAACLVAQTFTPGSQPLAVPPHTLLRQQLLRGQRALASGSLGAPGGTQVDHWGCILVSLSHWEEASPRIAGRGQIPWPVCCLSGPWGSGRPECSGSNKTLAVCPGQSVSPLEIRALTLQSSGWQGWKACTSSS